MPGVGLTAAAFPSVQRTAKGVADHRTTAYRADIAGSMYTRLPFR